MEIINLQFNLERFFNNLDSTQKRALMLDYDGTLAPFRVERDKALPYPGIRGILTRLVSADRTRIVIISGRRVKDLVPLIGLDVSPEIWGSHGLERLKRDGEYQLTELGALTRQGLAEASNWLKAQGLAGVSERKPSGIAFHWRGLSPDKANELKERIEKKWFPSAGNFGLILHEFDGGLELRVAGITKGNVVESIAKEMGGDAVLAYLGDDLTDEDAFNALRGRGLSVLVRDSRRETAADLWIKPPQELLQFLEKWIEYGG
jgi:trehalose 6-phosphate phosphatase